MDIQEGALVRILIKYAVEGLAVGLAASLISKNKLSGREIATLGLTAAVVFLLLDVYAPSVGGSARSGAGFGIGANAVGGLHVTGAEGFDPRLEKYRRKRPIMKHLTRVENFDKADKGDDQKEGYTQNLGYSELNSDDLGDKYNEYSHDVEDASQMYDMNNLNGMDSQDKYGALHMLDISFRPYPHREKRMLRHHQVDRSGDRRRRYTKLAKTLGPNKLTYFE